MNARAIECLDYSFRNTIVCEQNRSEYCGVGPKINRIIMPYGNNNKPTEPTLIISTDYALAIFITVKGASLFSGIGLSARNAIDGKHFGVAMRMFRH
jgi:hypothetical protein